MEIPGCSPSFSFVNLLSTTSKLHVPVSSLVEEFTLLLSWREVWGTNQGKLSYHLQMVVNLLTTLKNLNILGKEDPSFHPRKKTIQMAKITITCEDRLTISHQRKKSNTMSWFTRLLPRVGTQLFEVGSISQQHQCTTSYRR